MKKVFYMFVLTALILLVGCEPEAQTSSCCPACVGESSPPPSLDLSQSGTFTEGKWKYVYLITNPGTRSQGSRGNLFYDGEPVPTPEHSDDYYLTPWGPFFYTQTQGALPWYNTGWILGTLDANDLLSEALPLPGTPGALILQTRKDMKNLVNKLAEQDLEDQLMVEPGKDTDELTQEKDLWGTPYKLRPDMRSAEGGGEVLRLELTSAGPDKTFGTEDDITRHSNFKQISESQPGDIDLNMELAPESTPPLPESVTN